MSQSGQNIFSIPSRGKGGKIKGFSNRRREGADFLEEHGVNPLGLQLNDAYLVAMAALVIVVGLVFLSRVIYLQIFKGEVYSALAEGNRIKIERTLAPRGVLYDRNLTPLVKDIPSFTVKLVRSNLPYDEEEKLLVIERVAELLKQDSTLAGQKNILQAVQSRIDERPDEPVVILANNIDHETALRFKLEENLPGILLEQGTTREYIYGATTAHLTGYMGRIRSEEWNEYKNRGYYYGDLVGRTGLETFYESILRGQDEIVQIEVNVKGEEQKLVSREAVVPGNNLVLSIDLDLQKKLTESLSAMAEQTSGRGAAVAMDPNTGEILAMVSIPTFDSNIFIKRDNTQIQSALDDERQPLFNRAVSGTYPPGSTFKPIVAAAALSEGIITPRTTFYSSGGLTLGDWFFPDWKSGGHGITDLNKAIGESVNTYFYYLGGGFEDFVGLGVARINQYAKLFGLSEVLNIDLPGEAAGFLPTREWKEEYKNESWYVGDTYLLSIGQGDILLTPLQLSLVTSIFANGGTFYKPHLVKAITDSAGDIETMVEAEVVRTDVVDSEYIQALQRAYRETVLTGSAISLQTLPVTSAGKTGTAQVGGDQEPHGWFTGWAPYDKPEIVLTVLVENGIGGSTSALPVFRETLSWYFSQNE